MGWREYLSEHPEEFEGCKFTYRNEQQPILLEEEDDDFFEEEAKRYERLKDDLKVFQSRYDHDKTDVQNLKKLASTLMDLASVMLTNAEMYQLLPWLQDAISKLEEVLIIDGNDHEARFQKGEAHYTIVQMNLLEYKYCDLYMHHCKQAFQCFKDVQHKAPHVYGKSQMLENIRKYYPPGWDPESSDKVKTIQNPGLRLFYHEQKQKMKEEMIQEAVEKLLEAMSIFPYEDNREVVSKLAKQIYSNPWTGNKQVREYREELLASVKVAKEALSQLPLSARELKAGALALILLWDFPIREMVDSDRTVKNCLSDARSMLEKVLSVHRNDYEAMFYLGKVHYYLLMDNTIQTDSTLHSEHYQKAIEYFSLVRDKAPNVYKDSAMVEAVENMMATYSSKSEWRDTENYKRAKIMPNSSVGFASLVMDENAMLMRFVGVLFEAMSLGTHERILAAGEKSVKDHLTHELISLHSQIKFSLQDLLMKLF